MLVHQRVNGLILQVVAIEKRVAGGGRLIDINFSMAFHENDPLSWLVCHFYANSLGVISSIEGKQFTKKTEHPKFLAGFYKNYELCDRFSVNLFNSYWFSYWFFPDFPWIFHVFSMIFHDFPMVFHDFPMDFPMVFQDINGFPMVFLWIFPSPRCCPGDLKRPTSDDDVEARGLLRRALRDTSLRALRGTTAAGARCG